MNDQQKNALLRVAKAAVAAAVKKEPVAPAHSDDPELNGHCGCFVTLKNHDRLRGCIGQFTADQPLVELIGQMAVASSTQDSRFFDDPITADELANLEIEISVLSPMTVTEEPLNLRLGIDGIYITDGRRSGCFLPQVATETGWNKEQFLSNCCSHKALLPADAWKDPSVTVYLFTADAFDSPFANL